MFRDGCNEVKNFGFASWTIYHLGLNNNELIYLSTQKWPNYFSYISSWCHSFYALKSKDDKSTFILRNVSNTENNIVRKIENKHYKDYYITAKKFNSCMPTDYSELIDDIEGFSTAEIKKLKNYCNICIGPMENAWAATKIAFQNFLLVENVSLFQ